MCSTAIIPAAIIGCGPSNRRKAEQATGRLAADAIAVIIGFGRPRPSRAGGAA